MNVRKIKYNINYILFKIFFQHYLYKMEPTLKVNVGTKNAGFKVTQSGGGGMQVTAGAGGLIGGSQQYQVVAGNSLEDYALGGTTYQAQFDAEPPRAPPTQPYTP